MSGNAVLFFSVYFYGCCLDHLVVGPDLQTLLCRSSKKTWWLILKFFTVATGTVNPKIWWKFETASLSALLHCTVFTMRRTGLAAWSPLLLWSLISGQPGHVTCGVHWLGTGVMYAQVSTRPPPTCHSLTWSWHYPSAQSSLLQTIRASVVTLDFCTIYVLI